MSGRGDSPGNQSLPWNPYWGPEYVEGETSPNAGWSSAGGLDVTQAVRSGDLPSGPAPGQTSSGSGRRPKIDITNVQLTEDHLLAENLYNVSYSGKGGVDQMERDYPVEARRFQELKAVGHRGTPEQKAAFQALRELRSRPAVLPIQIDGIQLAEAHLAAEALYMSSYSGKGGVERMKREHPEEARLSQQIRAIGHRGTPEQKAALQALRELRKMQKKSKYTIAAKSAQRAVSARSAEEAKYELRPKADIARGSAAASELRATARGSAAASELWAVSELRAAARGSAAASELRAAARGSAAADRRKSTVGPQSGVELRLLSPAAK